MYGHTYGWVGLRQKSIERGPQRGTHSSCRPRTSKVFRNILCYHSHAWQKHRCVNVSISMRVNNFRRHQTPPSRRRRPSESQPKTNGNVLHYHVKKGGTVPFLGQKSVSFLVTTFLTDEGVLIIMHGRSRMTIHPRIPTLPVRSTSGFHRPGRQRLHRARSAVRCSASRMKGELHPTKNLL